MIKGCFSIKTDWWYVWYASSWVSQPWTSTGVQLSLTPSTVPVLGPLELFLRRICWRTRITAGCRSESASMAASDVRQAAARPVLFCRRLLMSCPWTVPELSSQLWRTCGTCLVALSHRRDLCVKGTGHQDATSVLQLCDCLVAETTTMSIREHLHGGFARDQFACMWCIRVVLMTAFKWRDAFFFQHLLKYNSYSQVLDEGVTCHSQRIQILVE